MILALIFAATATGEVLEVLDRPLRVGERIVVVGDSITGDHTGKEGRYVTLLRESLTARRPQLDITVIGAGVSNDDVHKVRARLRRDVLAREPTIVIVFVGVNDARGWPKPPNGTATQLQRYRAHVADYERALAAVVDDVKAAGADVVICTPAVDGELAEGHNIADETMRDYVEAGRRVAAREGAVLVDLRRMFTERLRTSTRKFGILTIDGVHLNEAGSLLVRDALLRALGA